MDFQPFKELIKETCGLCFEEEKEAMLAGGIRARMSGRGVPTESDYLACLRRDAGELHALINLLTINETYFFREPAHLNLLASRIFPGLAAQVSEAHPVRILCAGCSSGEEPYSVMMALLERHGPGVGKTVSVIGADIDGDVLARAEEGSYSGLSFRALPDRLREKYFEPAGKDRYLVREFVRERVRFMKLNLKGDVYPDALHGMDAIFYRNVSIYFEPETRRSIFDRLAGLLKEQGWLFVSSTETLSHNHGTLSLVERDGVFCYQKNIELVFKERRKGASSRTGAPSPADAAPSSSSAGPGRPAARQVVRPDAGAAAHATPRADRPLFDEALATAREKNFDEALRRIDALLEKEPSFVKAYVLKAGILINRTLLDEAEQISRRCLDVDRWCLEGYLLLGVIATLRSDRETAATRFREALYIQPSCWLAHVQMADIYIALGERKSAVREYEIAARLIEQSGAQDQGPLFPLAFPPGQFARLCHHNLRKLKQEQG